MFELNQKIALVTGASRGIGREVALTLARAGAIVIGTATTETGAAQLQAVFAEHGLSHAHAKVLNVTDGEACEALMADIAKEFGPLSILVNNAGITKDQLALRMNDADWNAVIQTNLSAVFSLCRLGIKPMMKQRHGRIINITSVVAWSGNPGQGNYCAAKAGVTGLSKSLAQELGSRNITVNCVAPGFIQTDMTSALAVEQIEQLTQNIPLKRMGEACDVAAAVLFLASEQASYVTGTTLHINGGLYMN